MSPSFAFERAVHSFRITFLFKDCWGNSHLSFSNSLDMDCFQSFPSSPSSNHLSSLVLPRSLPHALSSAWCPWGHCLPSQPGQWAPRGHSPCLVILKISSSWMGPRTMKMHNESCWNEPTLLRTVGNSRRPIPSATPYSTHQKVQLPVRASMELTKEQLVPLPVGEVRPHNIIGSRAMLSSRAVNSEETFYVCAVLHHRCQPRGHWALKMW